MIKFYIIVFVILLIGIFIFVPCLTNIKVTPIEKSKPYIENGFLHLELKTIAIKDIISIEIVNGIVRYVIIYHKDGMYSLPLDVYLKIIGKL